MIKTINAWRGIFAIVIVMFHSKVHLMDQATYLGVSFFFVASGFLLTMHHHDKDFTTFSSWWQFWWTRAKRIYLIHWLALALFMALYLWVMNKPFKLPEFISEFFLVHCWIPDKDFFFSFNSPSWFLGALLFHYACFPLINKYYSRLHIYWQLLIMLLAILVVAWLPTAISGQMVTYTYVCPLVRLGDFLLGVTAANTCRIMSRTNLKYSAIKATIIELGVILFALAVIFIDRTTKLVFLWSNHLIWWIPALLITLTAVKLKGQEGFVGRILTTRPFQFLGNISLEIYIFQFIVAIFVNYFISPIYGHFGHPIYDQYVWTQLPLLILLSWGIYSLRHRISNRITTTASIHD